MGSVIRAGSGAIDISQILLSIEDDLESFEFIDFRPTAINAVSDRFEYNFSGRNIDQLIMPDPLPFPLSAYEQIGIRFFDAEFYRANIVAIDQDYTETFNRISAQLQDQTDPLNFARAELSAFAQRSGFEIDFERIDEIIDELNITGIADLFSRFPTDADIFSALGIDVPDPPAGEFSIDQIVVAAGDDILFEITGDGLTNVIFTENVIGLLDGDDTIIGSAGADRIDGRSGADEMIGGDGDDRYVISQPGDRVIENPGCGFDRVDVTADIAGFVAPENVELVVLRSNVTTGTSPQSGAVLVGVEDDNVFFSGPGTDFYDGNDGIDTLSYENALSGVSASLLKPTAFNTGGAGTDKIDDIENLIGSAFDDVLVGAQGVSNIIDGGAGDDLIVGFAGPDTLIGGIGADIFAYNQLNFRDSLINGGEDRILDFDTAEDIVDLSRLGVQAENVAIEAGRIEVDVIGNDGVPEFAIDFANNVTLSLDQIIV